VPVIPAQMSLATKDLTGFERPGDLRCKSSECVQDEEPNYLFPLKIQFHVVSAYGIARSRVPHFFCLISRYLSIQSYSPLHTMREPFWWAR
jgi:hypothetical protein